MKPNEWYRYQIDGNQRAARIVFVPVFAHKYPKSCEITQINASKVAKSPCWKDCAVTVQVEETRAVSAWPTQEFTKFRFWSSCLWDDLNVTRCPSSCFMKTLCLESTLHIMLSRPIGPSIRNNGGQLESCPFSSWLGATCSNHALQWWKTQISDGWTRKAGRELHQSQHLSSEHLDLSCLITDEGFGNSCVITCFALLQAHTAAKVSGSEFCNIQLACHLVLPWFRSLTVS